MKKVLSAAMFALAVLVALVLPAPASAAGTDIDGWVAENITANAEGLLVFSEGGNLTKTFTGDLNPAEPLNSTRVAVRVSGEGACGAGAPRLFVAGGKLEGHILPCDGGIGRTMNGIQTFDWYSRGGTTKFDTWADAVNSLEDKAIGLVGLVFDNNAGRTMTVEGELRVFGDVVTVPQPKPEPKMVDVTKLPEPTHKAPTCEAKGSVVLPKAADLTALGVAYTKVPGKGGATVSVKVTALDGYVLSAEKTFGPYNVAQVTEGCEQPPAPKVVEKLNEPHVADVKCDGVTWWVEDVEGVSYTTNDEYGAGFFTVVATANEGYVIKAGLKTEWRLTYDMPDCTSTPQPGDTGAPGTGTPDNPGSGGSVGSGTDDGSLPKTGVAVLGIGGAGLLLVAVGGLLLVWARRRAYGHGDNDGDTQVMPAI